MANIKRFTTLILTTSSLALGGCSGGNTLLSRPEAIGPLANAQEINTGRITLQCKPAEGAAFGPIAGVLLSFATDFALNLGKEMITRAQERRSALYAINGVAENCENEIKNGSTQKMTVERLVIGSGGIAVGDPGLKLDADITFKPITVGSGNAAKAMLEVHLTPTQLIYGRAAPSTRNKGRKHVVLLISFADTSPLGTNAPDDSIKLDKPLRLDFGILQDGLKYDSSLVGHIRASTLMPMPKNSTPVVTAIVVETEDEILALKALGAAFDSNKDDLKKAVTGS